MFLLKYLGLGHEGMGALLPDRVRRDRGQHAHDPGQPLVARDVRFLPQLLDFSYSLTDLGGPEFL